MNTNKLKLALCALCGLLLLPQLSAAYEATDSSAVRISDDTVLFSITYRFGFLNRELRMPIEARAGAAGMPATVGFELRSGNDVLENIPVPAVVLTDDEDVTVEDGQYFLPRGRNAEFTLIGLLRITPELPTSALNLAITHLPLTTINEGEEVVGQVREEELSEYRTPQLTLIDGLTITADPQTFTISEK